MSHARRRKTALLTLLLATVVLLALPVVGAASALGAPVGATLGAWGAGIPAADVMPSFQGSYTLDKDGGVSVTETISYRFDPAQGVRHGIYRNITVRQGLDDRPDSYRYYAMSGVSVSSPTGANSEYQLTDNGSTTTIKIGSAKVDVSGTQTYVVSYHLANVMNPFTDTQTAEFYYNIFTSEPIAKDEVDLQVKAPAAATEVRCARGTAGTDCDLAEAGETSQFTVGSLASLENLTIAARYPLAAFDRIAPDIRTGGSPLGETQARAASYAALAGALLVPLLAGVGMGALVATRGRDEWYAGLTPGLTPGREADANAAPTERGGPPTIAVQFNPPPGVQPGLVGTVIDESADTLDVSASVIDLAVRGFLTIEEVDGGGFTKRTDWRLTRLVPPEGEVLRPYESTLLEGLFATANPVLLSDLKNHFSKTLSSVKDQMYDEVLSRGWFRKSPQRQRALWLALGLPAHRGRRGAAVPRSRDAGGRPHGWAVAAGPVRAAAGGRRRHRRHLRGHPGQAGARQDRGRVRGPGPVAGFSPVPGDGRGEPDPLGGSPGDLQPVPALRHRLRRGRAVGQDLRAGRRCGSRRGTAGPHADVVHLARCGVPRLRRHRLGRGQLLLDGGRDLPVHARQLRRVGLRQLGRQLLRRRHRRLELGVLVVRAAADGFAASRPQPSRSTWHARRHASSRPAQ